MIVLGLHGGLTVRQHEPSVALAIDGKIVAICEEERYLRIKSAYGYLPHYSIKAALDIANIQWGDINLIVTPGSTYDGFDEEIRRYLTHLYGSCPKIERIHHQMAHMSAAFYSSGLDESLVLSMDASGDGDCAMLGYGSKEKGIEVLANIPNHNSLGSFYTLMTYYLGFTDGDEYKVMGLAPYGRPEIDLSAVARPVDGGWELNKRYFAETKSPFQPTYSDALIELLGRPNRLPSQPFDDFYKNVASSTQYAFEQCFLSIIEKLKSYKPAVRNLCYAGGASLNCKANKQLLYSNDWNHVYVPAVASDRGLAVGCAYYGAKQLGDGIWPLNSAYLGSAYSDSHIEKELQANGIQYSVVDDPTEVAAKMLAEKKIIGWYQGRSEAGARALGNRSILANCSSPEMRDKVNARIKYREEFRPFAPACLHEDAEVYFDSRGAHLPTMSFTVDARTGRTNDIAAVVHEDKTSRLQTVASSDNELFYQLIRNYKYQTDVPVVMNTSFNLKGQPIVETPRDAIMTFFGCGLDALVLHHYVLEKKFG